VLETGRGKKPTADIPREIRSQIRSLVSKTSNETIDLVVNLTGKYIGIEKRKELKKKAKIGVGAEIEKAITETYQTAIRIEEEFRKGKLKTVSPREKFYSLTDAYFKPFMPEIPKNVHVMDDFFQVCEELKNFRFNWHYLRDTEYKKYLQGLEMLLGELRKTHKMGKAWGALNEFLHSKDFYPLLQATLQRVIALARALRYRTLSNCSKSRFSSDFCVCRQLTTSNYPKSEMLSAIDKGWQRYCACH
jgi:hypothetical protein